MRLFSCFSILIIPRSAQKMEIAILTFFLTFFMSKKYRNFFRKSKKHIDKRFIIPYTSLRCGSLAQSVEHWTFNPGVPGSSPG